MRKECAFVVAALALAPSLAIAQDIPRLSVPIPSLPNLSPDTPSIPVWGPSSYYLTNPYDGTLTVFVDGVRIRVDALERAEVSTLSSASTLLIETEGRFHEYSMVPGQEYVIVFQDGAFGIQAR